MNTDPIADMLTRIRNANTVSHETVEIPASKLKIELAKDEYVNAINEISNKYELPLTIIEVLLNAILNEVTNMKTINIAKEKEKIKEESENNAEN